MGTEKEEALSTKPEGIITDKDNETKIKDEHITAHRDHVAREALGLSIPPGYFWSSLDLIGSVFVRISTPLAPWKREEKLRAK